MALFARGKKGVVGLDIGSSAVKLVELTERKAGEFHLQRVGVELLSPEAIVDGAIVCSAELSIGGSRAALKMRGARRLTPGPGEGCGEDSSIFHTREMDAAWHRSLDPRSL